MDPLNPRKEFFTDVVLTHGAIDTETLSEPLKGALADAGFSEQKLTALAGKDHRIDSPDEALKLYNSVEKYVPAKKRETLLNELVAEFERHSVRELTLDEALKVGGLESFFPTKTLSVPGVNQFSMDPDPNKANKMCMPAAVAQIDRYFHSQFEKTPPLADKHHRIQVATHETTSGRIEVDLRAAQRARAYIDDCLDSGRPVLVGVSALNADVLRVNEGITEHFVTISGRGIDSDKRLFYEFRDPGDGGNLGRFYVDDETGKLFKPGRTFVEGAKTVHDMQYEVSQVRTYADRSAE